MLLRRKTMVNLIDLNLNIFSYEQNKFDYNQWIDQWRTVEHKLGEPAEQFLDKMKSTSRMYNPEHPSHYEYCSYMFLLAPMI